MKLSKKARGLIENTEHEIMVSAVSAIEIAIKTSLGRLQAPGDFEAAVLAAGFSPLSLGFEVGAALTKLPWHHNDPFDRLLVAQALELGVPIVSRDPLLAAYQVQVIW